MLVSHVIYQLFIGPLELILEIVYGLSQNLFSNCGLSIIVLSLTVNMLLLPLYRCADALQENAQKAEKKLAPWVMHIKKTFKGDERFMMLHTYYRQNGYKPYYVLKSSMPLFLEIPFFIAAYHFLSNLEELNGIPFGPVNNLGAPDGMLNLFGMTINLLPLVMTAINCVSSMIYVRDLPLRNKIQLYGMAMVFLVLLYKSPAGLVLYWILNNLFSLGKNIFYKVRDSQFAAVSSHKQINPWLLIGGCVLVTFLSSIIIPLYNRLDFILITLVLELPLLLRPFQDRLYPFTLSSSEQNNPWIFISGCIFLALLSGVLIPSSVIESSPAEFVQMEDFYSPIRHILTAACLSIGFFVIWPAIFYCIVDYKTKRVFDILSLILSGIAVTDYMLFGTKLGILSPMLQYETGLQFSDAEKICNFAALLICSLLLLLLFRKRKSVINPLLLLFIISILGMSAINIFSIQSNMPKIEQVVQVATNENQQSVLDAEAHFSLSRQGKNVIVLMLDRAINSYLPYFFQEKPELKRQFAGFTYYPNTISFGEHTNFGAPAIYGGYEYTPAEMNLRVNEPLVEKHNEALKVMPVLFDKADFNVTVCDPPYANYTWVPDLSIYDAYPHIKAYVTEKGKLVSSLFSGQERSQQLKQVWSRNFFCYSLMKISPLVIQKGIYQGGSYYKPHLFTSQIIHDLSKAYGQNSSFLISYAVLLSLPGMTRITDEPQNTFLLMSNTSTHQHTLLREPEYEPALIVDNTIYDNEHEDRFILNERELHVETAYQMKHYHVNMAAMIQLGRWMDYLREQGVYDNTRIIIVADHGRELKQFDDMIFNLGTHSSENILDVMAYNPLFMVKDFDCREFTTNTEFMTNADVPTIALNSLIENPINPFTHKPINNQPKYMSNQLITGSHVWDTQKNNGNTFLPGIWYSVHDNIFDPNNWENISEH